MMLSLNNDSIPPLVFLCRGLIHPGESRVTVWWLNPLTATVVYDCRTFPYAPFLDKLILILKEKQVESLYLY